MQAWLWARHLIKHTWGAGCCLGLLLLAGCPHSGGGKLAGNQSAKRYPKTARTLEGLWADPVLIPALTGSAKLFQTATGARVQVTGIERGALLDWAKSGDTGSLPAPDVVLYAGQSSHAALLAAKRIDEATARTFAGDRLVLLKPLGSTYTTASVFDLWEMHFQHLAMADPQSTSLGFYTQQALVGDGALDRLKPRLQTYPASATLPGLPAKNDSTLAFAFMSQSGGTAGVEPMLLVDKELHEAVQYRAAAAAGQGADPAVLNFLQWLAEDPATQTALGGYGLLDRASTLGLGQPPALPPSTGPAATPAKPGAAAPPATAPAG